MLTDAEKLLEGSLSMVESKSDEAFQEGGKLVVVMRKTATVLKTLSVVKLINDVMGPKESLVPT